MARIGSFDQDLSNLAWFDETGVVEGWFDDDLIGAAASGITGTGSTSQAQTVAATGLFNLAGVFGDGATSQAQTTSANGTATPPAITGTGATSQAQTIASSGSSIPAAVTGTGATLQAQTASGSGTYTPAAVTGTGTTSQAQTAAGTGTVAGAGITGTGATSQGQTSAGIGEVSGAQQSYSGEVKVYVKRGKKYYFFDTQAEADEWVEAETQADEAIAQAQKTSRRARKRLREKVYKALPEANVVDTANLLQLAQSFNVTFDMQSLIMSHNISQLIEIRDRLIQLQDEDDIEMLLLSLP